ncbi:MAG: energy-coupling factor transporter transmembrane component T [Albidovulum sp.]|jgi:biotin transport system permease protein
MISLTSPVETWAHRWPAGLKLILLSAATMVLFTRQDLAFHASVFAGCLALYALPGQVFLTSGLRRLAALWPFLAVMVIWHLVTGDILEGGVIVLRLLSAVALANLVTMTTRLSQMIEVVKWLSAPIRWFGFNTRALELGLALVIRFTPVLAEKGSQLSQSWRARAVKRANWRIVIPFTVLAIDDAERVAEAIKARGGL